MTMQPPQFSERAKAVVTERCLIATDIDQTLLFKGAERERQYFLENLAPELLRAASLGVNLGFLTGNSIQELTCRFLKWVTSQLAHTGRIELIRRFHFFCNAAGVYAFFSAEDRSLNALLSTANQRSVSAEELFTTLTVPSSGGGPVIRPQFIDAGYVERSRVPADESAGIVAVLDQIGREYYEDLLRRRDTLAKTYNLSQVSEGSELRRPGSELRIVEYTSGSLNKEATVQITLKPILSFRHAYRPPQLYGKDLRLKLIRCVQDRLDGMGLGHYVARPGGLSSIDVSLEKLDKAYALEFLIDRLNVQGYSRSGQKFGSNTVYIGDEVIVGGGNDYPVTRIPGLLVFAVNPDQEMVPFLSHVFVPSAILAGPDATREVLAHFNRCAFKLLSNFDRTKAGFGNAKTALESLKQDIFLARIREKIDDLGQMDRASVEDWQTLHAFVTLMSRNDPAAKQWLAILINELDAIMTQLRAGSITVQRAAGIADKELNQ